MSSLQLDDPGVYLILGGFQISDARCIPVRSKREFGVGVPGWGSRRWVAEEMSLAFVKPVARWGAAILLFLVLCHAAPRTALAACDHRATARVSRSADWNHLDPLIVGDRSTLVSDNRANDRLPTPRPPIPRPCSGPNCSSKVPVPNSTASQASGSFDHWGNLPAAVLDQAVVSAEPALSEPTPHSQSSRPSIFHPPPV